MKYTPHEYQIIAIGEMVEKPSVGLLMDPGLGKTSCSLAAYLVLKTAELIRGALVVCPLRPMHATWPAEVAKWDDFQGLSIGILHGPKKEKTLQEDHDIYLINPEGLKWLEVAAKKLKRFPFNMLIVDESTRFKNTRSTRFRVLRKMLGKFKRRYILTGTPAPNGLLDLFGQIFILDAGATLGKYITKYRFEHFAPCGYGGYTWELRPGEEKRIYKKLAPITVRLAQEDYLQLPELVITDHYIDLPRPVRALYDELEREFIVQLQEGQVTAVNAAVLTTKLRQVANGGVYVEDSSYQQLHYAKAELVAALVEEMQGQPCLVSYDFRHDLSRLQHTLEKTLGHTVPHIGAGVTNKRVDLIIEEWNAGHLPVVLGHPTSVAHGLNLQAGRAVIFHSLTWNLGEYEQFIRRVWRQGQTKRVFVHRIIARGTIDEAVVSALAGKARTQNALLKALKKQYQSL